LVPYHYAGIKHQHHAPTALYGALVHFDNRLVGQDVSFHALLDGMGNRNVAFQNVEIFLDLFSSFCEFIHCHLSPLFVLLAPRADAFINDSDDE
jgi:hypothetical protein